MAVTPTPPIATVDALRAYVDANLPLTHAMQARFVEATRAGVTITAPLAPNINHEATFFGGSISALGLLAGWSLMWCRLYEETPRLSTRLVVSHSETRYIRPIAGELTCHVQENAQRINWLQQLQDNGRAKCEVRAELFETASPRRPAAVVDALFVAIRTDTPSDQENE